MSYERVLRAVARLPWAIMPEKAEEIAALLELRIAGSQTADADLYAAQAPPSASQAGSVAVLPLYGVISQRINMMSAMSGGTSIDKFTQAFRQAVADPNVSAIVLDVDSPGGNVFGVAELASEIREARSRKPVVAVANSLMASAAYWIGSAASEISVTPGGQVGSIGVLALHVDYSARNEQEGIRPTLVSAGRYKAELHEDLPLTDEARGYLQEQVDRYYELFVAAVAEGRGAAASAVRSGYGQGRVVMARPAVAAGMADRIETLDHAIARLAGARGSRAVMVRNAAAGDEHPPYGIGGEGGMDYLAGPIPPHESPAIAGDDEEWDADAEVAAAEGRAGLRRMHVWVDDDGDPDAKGSYKGPHHRRDGTLVPRGLSALKARANQMDIPEADRAGVQAHIDRHDRELASRQPSAASNQLTDVEARMRRLKL